MNQDHRGPPAFRFGTFVTMALALTLTAGAADTTLEAGDTFPEFELDRADGSTYRSADYSGQPRLVLFWATWCPYCRKLMPAIVALDDEFTDQGLAIVAVNFRDDGDTDAYARRMGIGFDIVLKGDTLAKSLGVRGTPTWFLVDASGRVAVRSSDSNPENPVLRDTVARFTQGD